MRKKMRKLVVMVLALVMCMGLVSTTAFAADGDYTITINNSTSGYTYKAYQIFSGTLTKDNEGKDVLSDIQWGSGIDEDKISSIYTALAADETYGSSFQNAAGEELTSAAEVADALGSCTISGVAEWFADTIYEYLSTTSSQSQYNESADPEANYTISDLEAGYYLVENTKVGTESGNVDYEGAYTKYILEVVDNVDVTPKADIPSVDKTVTDNDANHASLNTGDEGKTGVVADYEIGDSVPFTITGTLPTDSDEFAYFDTYKMVFHDTLSKGLTYNGNSLVVTVYNDEGGEDGSLVLNSDYTVDSSTDGETGITTLTITLNDVKDMSQDVAAGYKIVVTYTATLNDNAAVGTAETNKVYLEYTNNPNTNGTGKSEEIKVYVWTFELDVTKQDENQNPLADVKFVVMNGIGDDAKYLSVDETTGAWSWVDSQDNATVYTTSEDGEFSVVGFDEGTYYLKETETLDGYNIIADPIEFEIKATYEDDGATLSNLTITVNDTNVTSSSGNTSGSGKVSMTIKNTQGSTLPSTGGIGTTVFYVVGIILVLGAAVILITRKRMSAK